MAFGEPLVITGIGALGNSAHQQPPSGMQVMAAPQRAQRVSIGLDYAPNRALRELATRAAARV